MNDFAARNGEALAARHPGIAKIVSSSVTPDWLRVEKSRSGLPTAFVAHDGGRVALHSQYDPRREAERLADQIPHDATVIVEGFGLGYHLEALIERRQPFRVLVLDPDTALLAAAVRHRDITGILTDPRIVISLGNSAEEVTSRVGELFQPLFSRNLESLPLSAWARLHQEWFTIRRRWAAAAAESVLDDVAAQGRFGLRWTRNSLVNLSTGVASLATAGGDSPAADVPATVTAAGPSLPRGLESLDAGKAPVFATDTSLPSLAHFGIRPQAVFSIDCQQISYHHFFRRVDQESLSLFEVASPPSLIRRTARPKLFLGEHPFHTYLSRRLSGLLKIDTKGGNVTFAAVDYLRQLGYRRIEVLGADYGYPRLEGYTNPSFLGHHFQSTSTRLQPSEGLFASFALDRLPQGERTTSVLQGYKRNLHVYVEHHEGTIIEVDPGHLSISFASGSPGVPSADREVRQREVDAVLSGYASGIREMAIEEVVERHVTGLQGPQEELEMLFTLVPPAQAISVAFPEASAEDLLLHAREWTLRQLSALYPSGLG